MKHKATRIRICLFPHARRFIQSVVIELYSDPGNMKADVSSWNGKQEAVSSIEHPSVARDQITEILRSDHALEQRFRKVTDLPER